MLGLTPSTTSRYINTLVDLGYLKQNTMTGSYELGEKVLGLTCSYLKKSMVYRQGLPIAENLAKESGLHIAISIPHGTEIMYIVSTGNAELRNLYIPIGHTHKIHQTAMGKVMLAFMPKDESAKILKDINYTPLLENTVTDASVLKDQLRSIKNLGYAFVSQENTEGYASIGAPIFNNEHQVCAAISLCSYTSKFEKVEDVERLSVLIRKAAQEISTLLGHFSL